MKLTNKIKAINEKKQVELKVNTVTAEPYEKCISQQVSKILDKGIQINPTRLVEPIKIIRTNHILYQPKDITSLNFSYINQI